MATSDGRPSPGQWLCSALCVFIGGGWLWTPKTLPPLPHRARSLLLFAGFVLLVGLARHQSELPELGERPELPISAQGASPLMSALQNRLAAHPQRSGIHLLVTAEDAFDARMALADAATRTLDVQVYIWNEDHTGTRLLEALHRAAERGVRVRLLLDDNGVKMDEALAALDAHPNAAVRLFNPFRFRTHRWFNFLTDFQRLNRRMHNKAFIADDAVAIVGGRNVGDEYFGRTEGVLFVDLDALAVGQVVPEVSGNFERYWQSVGTWPFERLVEVPEADRSAWSARHDAWAARIAQAQADAPPDPELVEVTDRPKASIVAALLEDSLPLVWAPVRMLSDHPDKALTQHHDNTRMFRELAAILESATERVELVSPYFVPGAQGSARLVALAQSGVDLQILTNSLEATDVAPVQAGYAKRRRPLLEGGVRLFELERTGPELRTGPAGWGSSASSGSSLHAKTFAVDGRLLFVGSFNFDPRSASLNTEMGFVIDAPELATLLTAVVEGPMRDRAYEVRLDAEGKLEWLDREGAQVTVLTVEPNSSVWMRMLIVLLGVLPIEGLL